MKMEAGWRRPPHMTPCRARVWVLAFTAACGRCVPVIESQMKVYLRCYSQKLYQDGLLGKVFQHQNESLFISEGQNACLFGTDLYMLSRQFDKLNANDIHIR